MNPLLSERMSKICFSKLFLQISRLRCEPRKKLFPENCRTYNLLQLLYKTFISASVNFQENEKNLFTNRRFFHLVHLPLLSFQAGCAFFAFQRFRQGADAAFATNYEADSIPSAYPSYPGGPDSDQHYQEPPFSAGANQRGPGDFQAPAY